MKKHDSEMLKNLLSKTLTEYLADRKISAYALEKELGLNIGTIYKAKEGSTLPGFETLYTLKAHDPLLSLDWLFTGKGPKIPTHVEYTVPDEFMGVLEQRQEYESKYLNQFKMSEQLRKELEQCQAELNACLKKKPKPRP